MKTAYLSMPVVMRRLEIHSVKWILLLLSAFVYLPIEAQNAPLQFHLVQTRNGLSINSVTSLEIDSLGFTWIGTQDGLNRFDGVNNKVFRNKDGQGLSADYIHQIKAIQSHVLIGTSKGIVRYSHETRSFIAIDSLAEHHLVDAFLWKGDAVIVTNKGFYSLYGKEIKELKKPKNIGRIRAVIALNHGDLLLTDQARLWKWNPNKGQTKPLIDSLNHPVICASRDSLWIGDFSGSIYTAALNSLFNINLTYHFPDYTIQSLSQSPVGICAGTDRGLIFLSSPVRYCKKEINSSFGLPSDAVLCVKGNAEFLVAGTNGGGMAYCFPQISSNELYQAHHQFPEDKFSAFIHDFEEDLAGNIWIASSNGLMELSRDGNYQLFSPQSAKETFQQVPIRTLSIQGTQMLLGTAGKGVYLIDVGAQKRVIATYTKETSKGLNSDYIFSMSRLKNGEHWLATNHGVAVFSMDDKRFHAAPPSLLKALGNKTVWRIYEDPKGGIWLSCPGNGILFYSPKTDKTLWLSSLPDKSMYDLIMSPKGTLWGASHTGLYHFTTSGKLLMHWSDTNGLPSRVCYGIVVDEKQQLWVGSNSGIFRFHPETHEIKTLGIEDGLQDIEFNQEAFFLLKDGRMLFGGVNGFNRIDPKNVQFQTYPGKVYFSKFSINGIDTSSAIKRIELPPGKHSLQFAFSLIGYKRNIHYTARYKIGNEEDSKWINLRRDQAVFIDQLPQGNGHFLFFELRDESGQLIESYQWPIEVRLHWYEQGWFLLGLFLLLIFTAATAYRFSVRQRERKLKTEAQLAELKMKSLRAQMNPHFLFNSMNSIQHLVIQGNSELAYHYLSGFSRLLRLILESSEEPLIELSKEIELIKIYVDLERLRFDSTLEVEVNCEDDLDTDNWHIPTLLLQPYVENAIWHGLLNKAEDRKLSITFKEEGDTLLCIVEDNGIGRKRAAEIKSMRPIRYESKGMRISSERLDLLGKEAYKGKVQIIDLEEGDMAKGTRVEIRIPPNAKKYD